MRIREVKGTIPEEQAPFIEAQDASAIGFVVMVLDAIGITVKEALGASATPATATGV